MDVKGTIRRDPTGQDTAYAFTGSVFNVQGYLSVGFTESEFTTARPTAGEVQPATSSPRHARGLSLSKAAESGCLFHAFTGFPPLVGFNVVFSR